MSALLALLGGERRGHGIEQSFVDNPADWLAAVFGVGRASSGVDVTEMSALEDPAVLSAIGGVAETMGSLPLFIYRRGENGAKAIATDHPLYERLHLSPNPEITSMLWREMKQAHLMLNGRTYSEIVRDGAGRVTALWPIHPRRVRVQRDSTTRALIYRVTVPGATMSSPAPGGTIRREHEVTLGAEQVLHIRALSLDGVEGLGRLRLMRESFGLSLALRLFGSIFFQNGATPGGVLEHPNRLSKEAKEYLAESWQRRHGGLGQAHRLAILEEGMKYHELAMPNNRAQYLESRDFQVGETARGLRVPGVMIGHNDKTSTYASAEQFFLAYVVHTVRPWCVRWDQALTMALLTPRERRDHFIEHKIDGLLRGDIQSRFAAYKIGRDMGVYSVDEIRALENMNPIGEAKGGNVYLVPLNMVPLDKVEEMAEKQMEPPPAPVPPDETRPDPDDDDDDETDEADRAMAQVERYARAAAARALRREIESVRKLPTKTPEEWRGGVDEFYARHTAYLAEVLHVTPDDARSYTADHRAQLLAEGASAADSWNGPAEAAMVRIALGAVV